MRGSDGYLVEQHPVAITIGALVLLVIVVLLIKRLF
jgi:hypothetical protein